MRHPITTLKRFRDQAGATATEYALLVALIAVVLLLGVGFFGNTLNLFFNYLGTTVDGWF